MTDPLAAARELLAGVRERYPAPLASVAAELLYELSASRPNYMRCFLLEIDLFEVSVAFFSFIQLAQLHRASLPLQAAEAAVLQLRDNPALCTGHWWGLLRETSRDVHALPAESTASAARELAGLYFDPGGKAARLGKILDQVPGLRNRVKGHAWTLPDEQYEAHARELLATLLGYLSCLEFLERQVLFQCLSCVPTGGGHDVDIAILAGDARRPRRQPAQAREPLLPGRLYLARRDDLSAGRLEPGAVLELHPYVQLRTRDGRPEAAYLLQALHEDEAELRSAVGGEALACPASGRETRALLDALVGRSPSAASPFGRLRETIAAASREALASAQGRASYRAEAYFVRPRLLRQVDQFIASGEGLALLAAPSGMGKTALACYLADRWLLSADETEAVLVVFAHELAAAGESLERWAQRRLGTSLAQLREAAARSGAKVLVIVDGLERAPDRLVLLEEASNLSSGRPAALRLLLTVTESVLTDLLRGRRGRPALPQLVVMPPLDATEGKKLYEVFVEPNSSTPRPPEELLVSLGTPLLIRLAQSAARTSEEVSAGQVLLAYTEQVIFSNLARAELIHRLVDRIIDTGSRTIPVADLARDEWLRSALLTEGADTPLQGLVRDGVLFIEWAPPSGRLPLPADPHIGFTFDQLRDFIVFTRLCRRTGDDLPTMLGRAADAGPSSPLIGGLRFLVLERLREGSDAAVLELLQRIDGTARQALLRELFLTPVGPRLTPALTELQRALFACIDPAEQKRFLEAARDAFDQLERRGLTSEAGALCSLASSLGLPAHPEQVLPLLCAWSRLQLRNVSVAAAEETARMARTAAEGHPDPSFHAEATASLAEALYTSGRRSEAAETLGAVLGPGIDAWNEAAAFAVSVSVAGVLHDRDREEAGRALARVRRLAESSRRPRWLAWACLAEMGHMLGSPEMAGSERAGALVEAGLGHARQAGHPALEAEACRFAAWCWQQDSARELTFIEAGLEAAVAGKDLAGQAELLLRLASWRLRVGRPRDAEKPACDAAALFERLGYRERLLRLRQHVLMMIEWELGRPGKGLTLLRGNLEGFCDMGMAAEASLSALLIAEMLADTGNPVGARALLGQARSLAEQGGWVQRLNYDLVTGHVLQLEGDSDAALDTYLRAQTWGVANRYADFIYQPAILAARLLLDRADPAKHDLERARSSLEKLLEDQTVDRRHRERYEGEMCTLYARLQAEQDNLEQAEVWLEKADEWFGRNTNHRGVPEWKAVRLLLDWLTASRLEQQAAETPAEKSPKGKGRDERAGLLKRAQGMKTGVRKRVQAEVLDPVRATASTFDLPAEAEGYYRHHPVHALLRRHGIDPA